MKNLTFPDCPQGTCFLDIFNGGGPSRKGSARNCVNFLLTCSLYCTASSARAGRCVEETPLATHLKKLEECKPVVVAFMMAVVHNPFKKWIHLFTCKTYFLYLKHDQIKGLAAFNIFQEALRSAVLF